MPTEHCTRTFDRTGSLPQSYEIGNVGNIIIAPTEEDMGVLSQYSIIDLTTEAALNFLPKAFS